MEVEPLIYPRQSGVSGRRCWNCFHILNLMCESPDDSFARIRDAEVGRQVVGADFGGAFSRLVSPQSVVPF